MTNSVLHLTPRCGPRRGDSSPVFPDGHVEALAHGAASAIPLDLWVVAEQDGGSVLTRLLGSGTLPAGATVTRSFDLRAPGNTPPGLYTVSVNVGTFPSTVLASDAFDVTVTGARFSGTPAAEPFVAETLTGDVFAADAFASSPSVVSVSPNPFAGQTALRFALASPSPVWLSVHDVLGREVAVLTDGAFEAGTHQAVFDGRGLASGMYVWRLASGGTVQTGRLTLLE